jgi:diguanylate cyclase (GGDEF)-like protein/PAS domain S-box-containing protein
VPLASLLLTAEGDRQRRRHLVAALLLANLLVAGVLAAVVVLVSGASRRAYEVQASDTAQDLAAIAQAGIASELSRVDAMLQATLDHLEVLRAHGLQQDADIDQALRSHQRLLPGVEGLRRADAQGLVRWGNDLPGGTPISIADRDYFQQARAHPHDGALLTGPLTSRVSGRWVMAVIRPAIVDGRFDGVVYATVTVDHFQQLFARYRLDDQDSMTLRTADLRLVARLAPGTRGASPVGDASVSEELRSAVTRNPQLGVLVSRTTIDRIERTTAYRRVEGWPLLVLTGIGNERFFAPWRAQTRRVALLALVAWALVGGSILTMYRAWRRESRSMRALAAQTQRTRTLLRVTGDGIHIVDRHGRLVEMSDSFAEMLGSTRERLLGRHISSWDANQDEPRITAWLSKIRDGDRQRVEVQHRREDGRILDVELQLSVTEIEGELLVFASARDISEHNRLLATLEASLAAQYEARQEATRLLAEQKTMLDNDIVGMVKLRNRVALWKNRALDRMFGYAPGELDGQPARLLYADDASYDQVGREAYAVLAAGLHYRTQLQMRRKDGRLMWVDLSGVRLSGDVSFWMMVDITPMMEAQSRIEHVAFHDSLTGLPNRLLLNDRLRQAILAAQRSNQQVAVCYLDLDGFKQVNDTHGHDSGDALLVEVAARLRGVMRGNDTAARVGGDEFVLVLTGLERDGDVWRSIVARVVDALHAPMRLPQGITVHIGTSVGVALAPDHGTEPSVLMGKADQAMLRAKRAGKSRVELTGL